MITAKLSWVLRVRLVLYLCLGIRHGFEHNGHNFFYSTFTNVFIFVTFFTFLTFFILYWTFFLHLCKKEATTKLPKNRIKSYESLPLRWDNHFSTGQNLLVDYRADAGYVSITRLDNMHCAEQQLSCQATAASRMARWHSWHTVPNLNTGVPGHGWAHNRTYCLCYCCMWMLACGLYCIKVRHVVIAITLTPVRHKRRMQFLNFRGQLTPWPSLPQPPLFALPQRTF